MWRDGTGRVWKQVSLTDLNEVATAFIEQARDQKIWLFHGEMGSGKTTFIKAICSQLGVTDAMSSPTFSIVNEYLTKNNQRIFHFDFYRIKNEAEAFDIGTEEYFYSGNYCFVEWPEKIPSLIPAVRAEVFLSLQDQNLRTLELSVHDGKEKNRI
jgi:tRNA threonylcarbamoyladenosine biosynthesis protein TsaE